ncbi:hypothetical protein [Campylobacter hyointestinalis]|uniref:hypothetical protein n=1 Tax=Campylobacter hyointestinalis TaxID=198 RepID=UPI0004D5AD6C|nr:hypothetical protein [Campylobacter hyointestinalis]ANE32744.1 putative membrane protein [Campylobacter hyointestinalis subsp. hyointestinalis LMG 9260]KEA44930.1 hypothetical protein CR67_00500 [Campylobacter hyointestinalis subsp. hyointestinalis]MBT0611662.1 3-isopropylmalate dehydratase [Campylobacter hyointestinalis subsp. hyointestinalis]MDY2998838.1 3-isopropylmalate dehydratase [Campylobacter hyointestinalis]QKF55914.1 putative membrane protein [Campylobacter hyointestinalis subsp. 
MNTAFARLDQIAPFIHISSSALFIAVQLSIVIFAKYFFKNIEQNPNLYKTILKEFGYFVKLELVAIFVLCISGVFAAFTGKIRISDPMVEAIMLTKWALLAFILLNIVYMWYKFGKAKKAFSSGDLLSVHENFVLIIYYFTPLNIVLSFISIYLGVTFRGFQ